MISIQLRNRTSLAVVSQMDANTVMTALATKNELEQDPDTAKILQRRASAVHDRPEGRIFVLKLEPTPRPEFFDFFLRAGEVDLCGFRFLEQIRDQRTVRVTDPSESESIFAALYQFATSVDGRRHSLFHYTGVRNIFATFRAVGGFAKLELCAGTYSSRLIGRGVLAEILRRELPKIAGLPRGNFVLKIE